MDFSAVSVLCVGDIMLDRFLYAEMERISPEAPVPVLRLTRRHEMLGGVGNVANNIASLGGRAILLGLAGRDEQGRILHGIIESNPRIEAGLVVSDQRPTICKTRFIAARQQVVRADEESGLPLTGPEQAGLIAAIDHAMPEADVVILSDYGKGALSDTVLRHTMAAAKARGVAVFVDPKSKDFRIYRGATCIKPNARELAAATDMAVGTDDEAAAAAMRAMAIADSDHILVTRSEKGMMLVSRDGGLQTVPTRAREVFDVSGAGDTVIATLALAFASGHNLAQAMHIANAAAGVVVSKLGTATADIAEIMHELDAQDHRSDGQFPTGAMPLPRLRALVERWKAQGLRVGFTNGCFDIVHAGHVGLLAAARAECDRLVVALNGDDSIRRLKGPTRPINTLEDRAEVMAAIRHVDAVASFEDDTPLSLIEFLTPDVLVKGADWSPDKVVGSDVVEANGGRVVLPKLKAGRSTTGIIARSQLPRE